MFGEVGGAVEPISNIWETLVLSKWWYFLVTIAFVLLSRFIFANVSKSSATQETVRKTGQLAFLIVFCGLIALLVGFFVFFGFSGDLANDLSMIMITATGFIMGTIFLWNWLIRKGKKN